MNYIKRNYFKPYELGTLKGVLPGISAILGRYMIKEQWNFVLNNNHFMAAKIIVHKFYRLFQTLAKDLYFEMNTHVEPHLTLKLQTQKPHCEGTKLQICSIQFLFSSNLPHVL